jgi:hypothetical protein
MAGRDRDPPKPGSPARNCQGAAHACGRRQRTVPAAPGRDRSIKQGLAEIAQDIAKLRRDAPAAVFENATSGPLADPKVNSNSKEHIAYNQAVNDLLDDYLKKNKITAEQMTPAQAEEFIAEVKLPRVPMIRNFVLKINREVLKYGLRYGPWRRGGGGDDE